MEHYVFDTAIPLVCVRAASFPDGVMDAHRKLHSLITHYVTRRYFSVSWMEPDGKILYVAGAEKVKPEDEALPETESFVVKKGKYAVIDIQDYMNNIPKIGEAFQQLLKLPELDPEGYCLEWYVDQQLVRCMVPVAP